MAKQNKNSTVSTLQGAVFAIPALYDLSSSHAVVIASLVVLSPSLCYILVCLPLVSPSFLVRFQPIHENWDTQLGDELDEIGDPPRVWITSLTQPGCAFTRWVTGPQRQKPCTLYCVRGPEVVQYAHNGSRSLLVIAPLASNDEPSRAFTRRCVVWRQQRRCVLYDEMMKYPACLKKYLSHHKQPLGL